MFPRRFSSPGAGPLLPSAASRSCSCRRRCRRRRRHKHRSTALSHATRSPGTKGGQGVSRRYPLQASPASPPLPAKPVSLSWVLEHLAVSRRVVCAPGGSAVGEGDGGGETAVVRREGRAGKGLRLSPSLVGRFLRCQIRGGADSCQTLLDPPGRVPRMGRRDGQCAVPACGNLECNTVGV